MVSKLSLLVSSSKVFVLKSFDRPACSKLKIGVTHNKLKFFKL